MPQWKHPARPWLKEYIERDTLPNRTWRSRTGNRGKSALTKTQEYAYDDYAVAILAKASVANAEHDMLMARTGNYKERFSILRPVLCAAGSQTEAG